MEQMQSLQPSVKQLNAEVARKIAAGEVIDRPNAIVRELMDNAVDSGATKITVELQSGGIEKIRVVDNGCGMTKQDLQASARPHATSKITTEQDLLNLSTLGFRGEALASMAAVSRLSVCSGGWKMNASVTEDHILTAITPVNGTIVQTAGLFENFPARRTFLKRPASEALLCKATFEEKALPRPDIAFSLTIDGQEKMNLPAGQTLTQRCTEALGFFEEQSLFYEVKNKSSDDGATWSFSLIIGEPSVNKNNRKSIYIFVNGRRITEYSLVQAIEYGCQGYFPNGQHPVACLFVKIDSSLVDFNIHPAKKEARFKDISPIHHAVSSTVRDFFKQYTVKTMISSNNFLEEPMQEELELKAQDKNGYVKKYLSPGTLDYSSVSRENSKENSFNKPVQFASSMQKNNDFNRQELNHSDLRSSFFNSSKKDYMESSYAKALIKDFSQGVELTANYNYEQDKRQTKPNYITNSFTEQSNTTHEYVNDKDFHFVGSTLGTFLIAEKADTLYIIDQHAAHERYIYNKIMAETSELQTLLVPYVVQTESKADDNYLKELQQKLKEAGFTAKDCGGGKWEFYTVPARWKGNEKDLAKDLLDKRINPQDIINAVAASTACRSAVMDGTVLDTNTAAQIAYEALKLPDPHCPHGRPVYTTITRKQLFALVKRI